MSQTVTCFELQLLVKVCERFEKMLAERGIGPDRLTLFMDLEHAHVDIPMDLNALLAAKDTDFAHDVCGIQRHMDRSTGKLGDCFVPRCALSNVRGLCGDAQA